MKQHSYFLLMLAALVFAAPIRAQGLANLSSRMDLTPGGNYIVGFVVPGTAPVNVLLRAVGTPLQQFGIMTGITAPNILVVDSKGIPRSFATFGTQGVLGPPYSSDLQTPVWSQLFAFVGAFPVPLNGTGAGYAFAAGAFNPGSYTVTITNAAGLGGTVLFELYVIPGPIPTID